MSELDLKRTIESTAITAVKANMKPVTVDVMEYIGGNRVNRGDMLLDVIIPASVGEIEPGDEVVVLKQNGTTNFFVIAKL